MNKKKVTTKRARPRKLSQEEQLAKEVEKRKLEDEKQAKINGLISRIQYSEAFLLVHDVKSIGMVYRIDDNITARRLPDDILLTVSTVIQRVEGDNRSNLEINITTIEPSDTSHNNLSAYIKSMRKELAELLKERLRD